MTSSPLCTLSHSQYLSNNQRARNRASVIEKSVLYHFREEADEFVEIGALNGLFVLGRSIGFIGELDNKKGHQNHGLFVCWLVGFI